MTPTPMASNDPGSVDGGQTSNEQKIRAAFESAKVVRLPVGTGGGGGGDTTSELALARLQRNDIGNAERFIQREGDNYLQVQNIGWHGWTGTHWSHADGETMAQKAAQSVAVAIRVEANALEEAGPEWSTPMQPDELEKAYHNRVVNEYEERVDKHRKWAVASGNSARLSAMLEEAQPHLTVSIDAMDQPLWLFNAKNFTIELKQPGEKSDAPFALMPHARTHRITRCASVNYEKGAEAPQWRKFLERVQPDESVRLFLARWAGYCLSGSGREQCLVICQGGGNNGKTTFIEVIAHVLGDYATVVPFESLLHDDRKSGSQASPDLARLPGTRFVTASEPNVGARLSESLIKTLTGGDRMVVRHLNRDFFEFRPQFKLTLSVNPKPDIRGTDEGIWRRLRLVPWPIQIPANEIDRQLTDKLKGEGAGILNWILDGWSEYREIGLAPPDAVMAATRDYREERDPIGSFLSACVVPAEGLIQSRELYDAYAVWCKANSREPFSSTAFGRSVPGRKLPDGSEIVRERAGATYFRGIALVDSVITELRALVGRGHHDEGPPEGHPAHPSSGPPDG